VTLRLLTYNIRHGGAGREEPLVEVIRACNPDIAILQEATKPAVVERLCVGAGMHVMGSRPRDSLAFISRVPIVHHEWHRPRASRHAFLEIVPEGDRVRLFGLHLSAVHAAWTERRRMLELRVLLKSIEKHQHGFHLLAGDFNTLAPGELLETRRLPYRLRPFVWLSGGRIRWKTIQMVLKAQYVDLFRSLNGADPGFTFPTWGPHVRLDYFFVPTGALHRVTCCRVVDHPRVKEASDHLPLLAECVA
jgi:exodeoxyribonuclease-3